MFWLVHCLIYKGGDSWLIFYSAKAISKLLVDDFNNGFKILTAQLNGEEIFHYFNSHTGTPAYYIAKDFFTFSVARYTSVLSLISLNSFLITTLVLSSISFIGIWKLYCLITELYPEMKKPTFYLIQPCLH